MSCGSQPPSSPQGDANIKFYEIDNGDIFYLNQYMSGDAQRGLGKKEEFCSVSGVFVPRWKKGVVV